MLHELYNGKQKQEYHYFRRLIMANILIVYYSRKGQNYWNGSIKNIAKGNTERVAEMIADQTGGTELEAATVNAYPDVYSECTEVARQEKEQNARPKLKGNLPVLDKYDTIFVGYPHLVG